MKQLNPLPLLLFVLFPCRLVSQQVDGGNGHSIILDKSGRVWTVGRNDYGQLGNGTFVNSSAPVRVSKLPPIKTIARGYDHTLAIDKNGCIWSWGLNNYGQLGAGLVVNYASPMQLKGHRNFIEVEGGHWHTIALKKDGSVWSWGHNYYGELGNGNREHQNSPAPVLCKTDEKKTLHPLTGIVSIKSVGYHTLALDKDGAIWSWGPNDFYQLGHANKELQPYARKIEQLPAIKSIAVGWHHSVALDRSGQIWMWGSDPVGMDNDTPIYLLPARFENLPKMKQIACGSWHSLAIDTKGNVWGWGRNQFGMLGTGTTVSTRHPVKIPGIKNACQIGAGCFQSLVIDSTGAIQSFGDNPSGQLGILSETRQLNAQPMFLNSNGEYDKEALESYKSKQYLKLFSLNNFYCFVRQNPFFFGSILLNLLVAIVLVRKWLKRKRVAKSA